MCARAQVSGQGEVQCARAHPFCVSQRPQGRLGGDLVCMSLYRRKVGEACQKSGQAARAHVRAPILYLRNDWTDLPEIW